MKKHYEIPRNFDIEILFRNHLSVTHIEQLSLIVKLTAKYMVIDRTVLNYRADKEFGLGIISKAVKLGLISEYPQAETNIYIYNLGATGLLLAHKANYLIGKLPIDASLELRKNILHLNHFLIKNQLDISESFAPNPKDGFVVCNETVSKNLVICYFDDIAFTDIKKKVLTGLSKTRFRNEAKNIKFILVAGGDSRIDTDTEGTIYEKLSQIHFDV